MKKLRYILKDKAGNGFPLVVAITLALVIILCGVMEFFRLNIIATGVKEALEDAIIVTVNDNYADVYHGVREGYSGGYQPDGSSRNMLRQYLRNPQGFAFIRKENLKYIKDWKRNVIDVIHYCSSSQISSCALPSANERRHCATAR